MKKLLFLLTMLLSISTYVAAQNYTEVVYLKNGSVIKGVILEQTPNVSLKIKTGDGSIIICNMEDVEKIAKEEQQQRYTRDYRQDNRDRRDVYARKEAAKARSAARKTLKGYKGFVEAGYAGDIYNSDDRGNKIEAATSHGYQFNNYIFLGGGMAVNNFTELEAYSVPIFANFKVNFINKKVTPFADIRMGYAVGDIEGFYAAMSIGVRLSLKAKQAIYLKLENSVQIHNDESYGHWEDDYYDGYGYNNYVIDEIYSAGSFGIKVGFEF